jgi:hypothetical protein
MTEGTLHYLYQERVANEDQLDQILLGILGPCVFGSVSSLTGQGLPCACFGTIVSEWCSLRHSYKCFCGTGFCNLFATYIFSCYKYCHMDSYLISCVLSVLRS